MLNSFRFRFATRKYCARISGYPGPLLRRGNDAGKWYSEPMGDYHVVLGLLAVEFAFVVGIVLLRRRALGIKPAN